MRKPKVLITLGLIIATACLGFVLASSSSASSAWPTASQLSRFGVTLSKAQSVSPSSGVLDKANKTASTFFIKHSNVLDTRYLHCQDVYLNPKINKDCIAVAIDPTGIRVPAFTGKERSPTWCLVLINPKTNKIIQFFLSNH